MPLLGLMANKNLDSIDNPRLVHLKQKTLGWRFTVIYISGKKLGGMDALSMYGVHHCQPEGGACITEPPHQCGSIAYKADLLEGLGTRKHLVGLLETSSTQQMTTSAPLLLDSDTHFLASLSSDVEPVTWEEVRHMTSKDKNLQLISTLVQSTFPQKKQELPLELQQETWF